MQDGNKEEQKNKISVGLIITNNQIKNNDIIPDEIKSEILGSPYYLLIFISREGVVKINCFPSKTDAIKKILIKLKEFSPDLVKGISSVLKELNLSKDILHTTGLCYEMENCFYETYLIADAFDSESSNITIDSVKEKFTSIAKVVNVIVEDIPKS